MGTDGLPRVNGRPLGIPALTREKSFTSGPTAVHGSPHPHHLVHGGVYVIIALCIALTVTSQYCLNVSGPITPCPFISSTQRSPRALIACPVSTAALTVASTCFSCS